MKNLFVFFAGICMCFGGYAAQQDSVFTTPKQASFIDAYSALGTVFNTNDFVKDIPQYQAFSLRYARASNGSSWEDITYNMPYWGMGLYVPFFTKNPGFGKPFSFYLFRGSTLTQFTDKFGLVFEVNLGLSLKWNAFDPVDNPENIAIGSPHNIHVGLRTYLEYFLSDHFDMKLGIDLNHFSNGSARKPNRGVNMGGVSLSLAYHFNPPDKGSLLRNSSLQPLEIPFHIQHDVHFIFSNRQTDFPTEGTNLPSEFVDKDFMVLGLVYSPMIVKNYKYKWGPSLLVNYDESSKARAWREDTEPTTPTQIELASFPNRLSLGVGLRGEISMPFASVFAIARYNIYHPHHFDRRFSQIIGVKAYLKDNFFGTFGVSAMDFSVAQYLFWSFGYTFSPHPRR